MTDSTLVFTNNEVGVREEDVRSLSTVNGSTKVKGSGAIGKKGIGFKSVFAVTSRPIVRSRAFHFYFDSNDADMRYEFLGLSRRNF